MVTRFTLFFVTLLLSLSASSAPNIEHWTTENGGRVYYASAPELPMVDIQVVFDAGAAQDKDLPGIALLANSMLSEGAGDLTAEQISAGFDDVGAQFGSNSERDMASLSLRSLTEDTALKTALELMTTVLAKPTFPQDAFERLQKQMLIGLQGEKQSPSAIARRAFYKNIYGEHPYASMPAGDAELVPHLTVKSIQKFYRQYYVARNATIVIVGAVTKEQAQQIAEQLMSGLAAGEMANPKPQVTSLTESQEVIIEHPSSQTHILMGQPGTSRDDKDYFALYVGNHIFGGSGLVSLLSNEIREKRGLSYSAYSYFRPMHEKGPYQLGLQTRNDQAQEALKVMKDTLAAFIIMGPTEEQLKAAKQNITGGFALRLDSNSKIAGYLAMIGFYGLPLDYLNTFKTKVNNVTAAQIKDAFSRRVHPETMVTVLVGGKAEQK